MTLTQTLFSFNGRINRAKWWLMRLLIIAALGIAGMLGSHSDAMLILSLPLGICSFWANLAVNAKRWHDRDKSAWWLLIELVPCIGGLWAFIELGCLKGTDGKNRFGPDPLESL